MSLQSKTMLRVFDKLKLQRSKSTHHVRGFLVHEGRKLYPPIHISKGKKEVPKFVQDKLRKALFLSRGEFSTLCKCKLSGPDYYSLRLERDSR